MQQIAREEWFDRGWWNERLSAATSVANPALCNLRITLTHYDLSLALRSVLGEDSGPNYHTWAVWGSKNAGASIRHEHIPGLPALAPALGGGLGLTAAMLMLTPLTATGPAIAAGMATAAGAWGARMISARLLNTISRKLLGGNVSLLNDIGPSTARFVCTFRNQPKPDPERLMECLSPLRSDPSEVGGQGLLRQALTHYYYARYEPDFEKRHEHMLMANLCAILHENIVLEPYIDGAIPRPLRKWATAHLLCLRLGGNRLTVDDDVPAAGGRSFPDIFQRLENPDLLRFLIGPGGWDRTPDTLAGSGARDWSEIKDRMNYTCDLFRSRHFDAGLFDAPYTRDQQASILAGRVPPGPL